MFMQIIIDNLEFSGNSEYFFTGSHEGEHICSCGETDSCMSNGVNSFVCNCDANLPTYANDAGLITAKELLPMTGVFYGPLLYDSQNATFTVGRLRCTGS